MEDIDISGLLNQTVAIRISEPKSFGTEHGTGPFPGTVSAIRDNAAVILLETTAPFRGETIVQVVATPRYERDRLTLRALDKGVSVTLTPVTQLDIAEFGDDFTIAAARRSWGMAGDLMLAGDDVPRLNEATPPFSRPS
jgi:hypothetical protein